MPISLSVLVATLPSCSTPPPTPADTPRGQLCTRAYHATIEALSIGLERSGQPLPRWPDAGAYLERCLALELSEAQLGCLDPDRVVADPAGCDEVMASAGPRADTLTRWFMTELQLDTPGTGEDEISEGNEP